MKERYGKRFVALGMFTALLFGILIWGLIDLQIRSGDQYGSQADTKRTKVITTKGDRGMIMDANSQILAQDKKIYDIQFYRDPTWTPGTDIAGLTMSQTGKYTKAILDAIEVIERNGSALLPKLSLEYFPDLDIWDFSWNALDITDDAKQKRENQWRENFYLTDLEKHPKEKLFEDLCIKYKLTKSEEDLAAIAAGTMHNDGIPTDLTQEQKLQVLAVWQEMQMNAFQSVPVTIAGDVSWETVIELEARSSMLPGISIAVNTKRVYPRGLHMSHLIGYIGKIHVEDEEKYKTQLKPKGYKLSDLIGLDGVEKSMEDWLTPNITKRLGTRMVEIDRYGAVSRVLENTPPQNGNNVKLTIDSGLQAKAEIALEATIEEIRSTQEKKQNDDRWKEQYKDQLEGNERDFTINKLKLAEKGAVIVVDMQGRVLAMASYPPYDPNAFIVGGQPAQQIIDDTRHPLMNNAIQSLATPGSIFKMVTASAGMAMGKLSPYDRISDMGPFTKYDKSNPPHCWLNQKLVGRQHLDQTVVEGLQNSCNYFFYTVASNLGADALYEYAALFGLTSKTYIELPGELKSYVGNQKMLYDPTRAIDASEQATWRPFLVADSLKKHLLGIARTQNITFDPDKLDYTVKALMDMAVEKEQSSWVSSIRAVLMEELDMPRELVYLQVVVGDIYTTLNEIKWGGNETIMTGIGQSITMVTPAAVARYVAAVANGGTVYDLSIIDSIIAPDGTVVSKHEPVIASSMPELAPFIPFIHQGMQGVVDEGGTASAYFDGFKYVKEMAGKTGTAQVSKIDLENNAWFVAFAPYENPEIAVVCYIPNGFSGGHASLAVREIIGYYLDQRSVEYTDLMPAANSLAY